jgi:hypothetical protein
VIRWGARRFQQPPAEKPGAGIAGRCFFARVGSIFKTPPVIDKHGTVLGEPQDYRTGDLESGQIKKAGATACRNAGLLRFAIVSPDLRHYRRLQAEVPLIQVFEFGPSSLLLLAAHSAIAAL